MIRRWAPPIPSAAITLSAPPERSSVAYAHRIRAPTQRYRPEARYERAVALLERKNPRCRRAPRTAQAAPPFPCACNQQRQDGPPALHAEFLNPCSACALKINKDKDRCNATTQQ